MRRLLLATPLAVAFALLPAGSASAACYGTANTATFCYVTGTGTYYEDCVYLGTPPCTVVQVTGPVVFCGGQVLGSPYICSVNPNLNDLLP